jgi:sugar/nucleoside kinase (ribokinase family)
LDSDVAISGQPAAAATSRDVRVTERVVHVFGTVFFDVVFSGLSSPPRPGTEVRTDGLGLAPGGVANVAVALARLGLRVRLSSAFADDALGRYLWATLEREGIDLSASWSVRDWSTPLTVSMAYGRERSMVTHERPAGRCRPPDTGGDACVVGLAECDPLWLGALHDRFTTVFADVGWDPGECWGEDVLALLGSVDVFLPNAAEATAYAREPDAVSAALRLAEHVPLVVVKCGAEGALAASAGAGAGPAQVVAQPALPVEALDTTGAGDVFDAGFIFGTLAGWPLERRLRFANLCAGESVAFAGGSLSAPCWRDLQTWWEREHSEALRGAYDFMPALLERYRPDRRCERPCASLTLPDRVEGRPRAATAG